MQNSKIPKSLQPFNCKFVFVGVLWGVFFCNSTVFARPGSIVSSLMFHSQKVRLGSPASDLLSRSTSANLSYNIANSDKYTQRKHIQDTSKYSSLQDFLKKGKFNSHSRFFSMITNNAAGYTDYYANAFASGIEYNSAVYKNLLFQTSAYAIMDLGSSDFTKLDSLSNQPNRYEIGLFDVANPGLSGMLIRLEDLNLKYSLAKKGFQAVFGKQLLKTPFINPQDGRMRPTMAQGLMVNNKFKSNIELVFGAINKISPRSTMKWYDVGNSMGLYASGVNPNGSKSNYVGNLPQTAIFLVSINKKSFDRMWEIWVQSVPQIFQTYFAKCERIPKQGWVYGIQTIYQHALKFGGNQNPLKTYFPENNQSLVFSGRIGYAVKQQQVFNLNATRITAKGRYLMPREWGRDPFYTFMPRERNEGYGDVWALTVNYTLSNKSKPMGIDFGLGRFQLPSPSSSALNKYAFPSYYQANINGRYQFQNGLFKGLSTQLLVVGKKAIANQTLIPKYEFNKVNLLHINLILSYSF